MSVKSKIVRNTVFGICCFMYLAYEAMTTNRADAWAWCSFRERGHHYVFNSQGQVVGDAYQLNSVDVADDGDGNPHIFTLQKPERNGSFRAYRIISGLTVSNSRRYIKQFYSSLPRNIFIGVDQFEPCEGSAPKLFDSNGRPVHVPKTGPYDQQ